MNSIILSLLLLPLFSYAQLTTSYYNGQSSTFKGTVSCDDTVNGKTSIYDYSHEYSLNIGNGIIYLLADSCASNYDTEIYLYNEHGTLLTYNLHPANPCSDAQAQLFYGPLSPDTYILQIEGNQWGTQGDYVMAISCLSKDMLPSTDYYVSKNGVDTDSCGEDSNPCGTLYQVSSHILFNSVYIELFPPTIYIMDGQNESEISRHVTLNDTDGFDPCLPMYFHYAKDITITFNSSQIYDLDEWLPRSLCDHHIGTGNYQYYVTENDTLSVYNNQYLFYGAISLTLNNLIVNNYDWPNYALIRGHYDDSPASITCNNCKFINISWGAPFHLIHSSSNIYLSNTEFDSLFIAAEANIIYTYPLPSPYDANRSIVLEQTTFYNIKSEAAIINFTRPYADISEENGHLTVWVNHCNFDGIDILNKPIMSDATYQSKVIMTHSNINIISGAIYHSEHLLSSTIHITNISIISSQIESGLELDGIFYFAATDTVHMELINVFYSYNVTKTCYNLYMEDYGGAVVFQTHGDWVGDFTDIMCKNPVTLIQNHGNLKLSDMKMDADTHNTHTDDYSNILYFWYVNYAHFQYDTSDRGFIENIGGVMDIQNTEINRTVSYIFILNTGRLSTINVSFASASTSSFDPNSLQSEIIIAQIGTSSYSYIKQASFIGSYRVISIEGGSSDIVESDFSRSNIAIHAEQINALSLDNCSFVNIGTYYGQVSPLFFDEAMIQIYFSDNIMLSHNNIYGYDEDGFIQIEDSSNISIIENIFNIQVTEFYYYVTPYIDLKQYVQFVKLLSCNNIRVIGNDFSQDPIGKTGPWIHFGNNIGLNCMTANTFVNYALFVQYTNITSCFRAGLIQCTIDIDNSCIHKIHGYINESLSDTIGHFIMDNSSDKNYVIWAENSHITFDNIQISGYPRAYIYRYLSTILLVDALITVQTWFPSEYGEILYQDVAFNDIQFVRAILFQFNDYPPNMTTFWVSFTLQDGYSKLNYVNYSAPTRINFIASSASYYPGQSLKFEWNITDRFGNIVDKRNINTAFTVKLKGTAFLSDLTIDENGECFLCDAGVLLNDISLQNNIGDIYEIIVEISDNSLILDKNVISLNITGCPSAYGSDANNFTCAICETNYYSFVSNNVEKCESCDVTNNPALHCTEGNVLIPLDHWAGFSEANNLISAVCPSGYCCTKTMCNYMDDKEKLCALNRDVESVLCGICNDGYSESMNSNSCTKCDADHWEYLLIPLIFALLFSVFLMGSNAEDLPQIQKGKNTKEDKKEDRKKANKYILLIKNGYFKSMIQVLVSKNIMYYEQSVSQILSASSHNILFNSFASMFNLSLTSIAAYNGSDENKLWCFIDGLNGKGKILADLFMPIMIFVIILIVYLATKLSTKKQLIIRGRSLKGIKIQDKRVNFAKAFIAMYLIIIGKILDAIFRILSCQRVGQHITVHFYFAYEQCYGSAWNWALLFLLIIIISFISIFVKLKYYMDESQRQNTDHILNKFVSKYKPQCYYWELILFFRRVLISMFAVSVVNTAAKLLFLFIIIMFAHAQRNHKPFINHEANYMEDVLLLFLIFIIAVQIAQAMDIIVINAMIAVLIILPLFLMADDVYRLFKKLNDDKYDGENQHGKTLNLGGSNNDKDGRSVELCSVQITSVNNDNAAEPRIDTEDMQKRNTEEIIDNKEDENAKGTEIVYHSDGEDNASEMQKVASD